MYHVLQDNASAVSENDLRAQMEREYGDVWHRVWMEDEKGKL